MTIFLIAYLVSLPIVAYICVTEILRSKHLTVGQVWATILLMLFSPLLVVAGCGAWLCDKVNELEPPSRNWWWSFNDVVLWRRKP